MGRDEMVGEGVSITAGKELTASFIIRLILSKFAIITGIPYDNNQSDFN